MNDPAGTGAAAKLQAACAEAYAKYPHSCSHSVWQVLQTVYSSTWSYMPANGLVDYLSRNWAPVTVDRAFELAQVGVPVVGGAAATPNGHVIIVYPGPKSRSGGYIAISKKSGKPFKMPVGDLYPLAMSTSLGSWAGAKSKGEKTVWDPWGSDEAFDGVRFWAPKERAGSAPVIK
jgi:hypothetical protein